MNPSAPSDFGEEVEVPQVVKGGSLEVAFKETEIACLG